jgi:PleD family two-component response regulator
VVALHFTGMAALSIEAAQMDAPSGLLMGSTLLATVVIAVSTVILVLSLAGASMDQHLSRRHSEEARNLHHLAHHDALTGLPNRFLCHHRVAQLGATLANPGARAAILCLDLDRFK